MPKVQRHSIPKQLMEHLLLRMRQREISYDQLVALGAWLDTEPAVPAGRWFKRFPAMTVCGEGSFITTFLRSNQTPTGDEVR